MYTIHASCNVGVQDDSDGTVYVCAFKDDFGVAPSNVDLVTSYILTNHITNPAIVSTPFFGGDVQYVHANVYSVVDNIEDIGSSVPANINELYSFYILAVDEFENRSALSYGSRNFIRPQNAPVVLDQVTQMSTSNVDFSGNLSATVNYVYKTATFTYLDSESNIATFFSEDNYPGDVFAIDDTVLHPFTHTFSDRLYNDALSNTDYNPFVDTTVDHYTHVHVQNNPPHDSGSAVYTYTTLALNTPRPDITITNATHARIRDASATIEFTVGNVENTEYVVCAYATSVSNPETSGALKAHMFKYGVISTVSTTVVSTSLNHYYNTVTDTVGESMSSGEHYFVYMCFRDTITGQYTHNPVLLTVVTGAPPVVSDASVLYNRFDESPDTITVTANVEEEQPSGANVYAIAFAEGDITDFNFETVKAAATQSVSGWDSLLDVNPMSVTLTYYYDNANSLYAPMPFVQNKRFYIHLLFEDSLMNKDVFTSANMVAISYNYLSVHDSTGDTALYDNDPNTVHAFGVQTANVDFQFEGGHRVLLTSVTIDLSNIACSNISDITLVAGNDGNVDNTLALNYTSPLTIGARHLITVVTSEENIDTESFTDFRVRLETADPEIVMGSLRFEGIVYDDRSPVLSNVDTTGANISFDVVDYSDVNVKMFRSLYHWTDTNEIEQLFGGVQTYEGPMYTATPAVYTDNTNNVMRMALANMVVQDAYVPSNENYITYVSAADSEMNQAPLKKYGYGTDVEVTTPTGDPAPQLTFNDTYIYENNSQVTIHVDANITDTTHPFKYKLDVTTETNVRSTSAITADEWSEYWVPGDLQNLVTDIENVTNTGGSLLLEGQTYVIQLHCKNSIGLTSNIQQTILLNTEGPTISMKRVQFNGESSTVDVSFTVSIAEAEVDANVYGAMFTQPFAASANAVTFFEDNGDSGGGMKRVDNVNGDEIMFAFDGAYDVVNSQWLNSVDEANVYYIYTYAKENKETNALHEVRTSNYGASTGAFSLTRMTGNVDTDPVGLFDDIFTTPNELTEGDYSNIVLHNQFVDTDANINELVSHGAAGGSVRQLGGHHAIMLTDNQSVYVSNVDFASGYLLTSMWVYPTSTNIDANATLIGTDLFSLTTNLEFHSVGNDPVDFGTAMEFVPFAWNNLALEVKQNTVYLYINNDVLAFAISTLLELRPTPFSMFIGSNVDGTTGFIGSEYGAMGIDSVYVSTYKPFFNNPTDNRSFTRLAAVDISDVFAPSVTDITANISSVSANVMDQYSANVYVAAFETYYGSVEPYAGKDNELEQFFETASSTLPHHHCDQLYMATQSVSMDFATDAFFANMDSSTSLAVDLTTGSYHVYLYVHDESNKRNSRVIYAENVFGSDLVSDTPVLNGTFTVSDGDSKGRAINASVTNTDPSNFEFVLAAYPHNYLKDYLNDIRYDYVRVHMNEMVSLSVLTPSPSLTNGSIDTYFANVDSTALTGSMAFATQYDVYLLVTNLTTREQIVVDSSVFTAVPPTVVPTFVKSSQSNDIDLSGTLEEESTDFVIYAAVFAPGMELDESRVKDFFKSDEFVNVNGSKFVTNTTSIAHTFNKFHTNLFFHDEVYPLLANPDSDYQAVIYVVDNTKTSYNEFYNVSNVAITTVENDTSPIIKTFTVNPLDQSANVSFSMEDLESNVDARIVLFNNNVPPVVVSDFLTHANVETYGLSINNAANIEPTTVNLDQAINLRYIDTEYTVANVDSVIALSGHPRANIHMFTNQVYTFNVQDNTPFYIGNVEQDNNAMAYNDKISYITTDSVEYNTASGLSNLDYVRFRAPEYETTLYYGDWNISDMGGTIHVVDSSNVPLVNTTDNQVTYYAYAFVRDTSVRQNSNIDTVSFTVGNAPVVTSFSAAFTIVPN